MAVDKPPESPPSASRKDRDSRLAEALRENLKRRKAQARDRREEPDRKDGTPS